uniref:Hemerythrin n=1 Tax=Pectinaria gouldii TaxID=260746 RepID=A0A1S6QD34_PECGU|nr:hemerythrin [Pectinaria gouldii]
MPFTVPEPYCWDDSFMTFYDQVDNEHKGLFQIIFDVAINPICSETLKKCLDLMVAHFTYEQGVMIRANYHGFPAHKAAHDEFIGKLSRLTAPVNSDDVDFCKDWLVQHVKNFDFDYRGKL